VTIDLSALYERGKTSIMGQPNLIGLFSSGVCDLLRQLLRYSTCAVDARRCLALVDRGCSESLARFEYCLLDTKMVAKVPGT
jgi:hypothetical protein